MTEDALKFFINYVNELLEVGGPNLPKTISTKLGLKLGRIYKEKDLAPDLESGLLQIYKALGGKPVIKKIDDYTFDVTVKHRSKFCPIGGKYNPSRAEAFVKSVCIPYTVAFISEISPTYKIETEIKQCVMAQDQKYCHYMLKLSKKNNAR